MVLYYLINRKNRLILTITAILAAILLNGIFSYINDSMGLPIFMDSIFTIMTAALFGLWPSVAVSLLTNVFIELLNGFPGIYLPFIPVSLFTALITSFFVYKKLFESPTQAFWLIIILVLVNSLTGSLIVSFFFGGFTNLSMDNIVRGIIVAGHSIFSSAFIVRLIANLVDKGPAVILSFFIYKAIQKKTKKKIRGNL
jgi:energy-coupling factor transport system substrate-specific component